MAKSAGAGWGLATLMGCGTLVGAPPADNPAHASRIESAEKPPAHRAEPPSIVLVAIDGARWQDVFLGTDRRLLDEAGLDAKEHAATADVLTPHLAELARQGIALGAPGHGAPFLASGPNFVSMPGYSELLTGHPARCQENDCDPPAHTVFDAFGPRDAAFFASWHRLGAFEAHVPDSVVMSAGRLSPPPRDWIASTDPTLALLHAAGSDDRAPVGDGEYRSDVHTRAIALAYFERTTPAFMFVSLGDTDEHGHDGDYAGYVEALRGADRFVGDLVGLSASLGRRTIVFVTADHGRADDFRDHGRDHPESARSFLIAGGAGIPARGWVSSPEPRHLADVAPTIAALASVDFEPDATEHGVPIPELVEPARPNR